MRDSHPGRQVALDAQSIDPLRIADPRTADLVDRLRRFTPDKLLNAERSEIAQYIDATRTLRLAYLRDQIVNFHRIDLLTTQVLGYQVKPFHLDMQRFQFQHRDNLQLCFRGAGKSVTCTICKSIYYVCVNRNLRQVIASKKYKNATKFLTGIREHLVNNRLLIELFGQFQDPNPRSTLKWTEGEICVFGRTNTTQKESTITCVGVDGSLAGGHYDVEFSDDIVDNKNSLTKEMRDKIEDWYWSILDPCMEPADAEVPYRGDRNRLGTRYHYDDFYGRLIDKRNEEIAAGRKPTLAINVIPALNEEGQSPWPEKWHPDELMARRRKYGLIIFSSQYQCSTDAMRGEIIKIDDCQPIAPSVLNELIAKKELRFFMGVDLAISEEVGADKFAIVVLGMDSLKRYYVVEHFSGQLRFSAQTAKIAELWRKWKVEKIAVEANGYQGAQLQNLKDKHKDIPLKKITQKSGETKIPRAWRLSAIFEQKRFFFPPGNELLIEELVLVPACSHDDSFDALDLAVQASKQRERKQRQEFL